MVTTAAHRTADPRSRSGGFDRRHALQPRKPRDLQRAGYDVISTQSGDTAISYMQREHVDVLLVDLRIPDTRGDVVFESGAAHQPQLRHQTVFMTGDLSERGMDLVSWCKCPLLRKPFELSAMLAVVNSVAPQRSSGVRSA